MADPKKQQPEDEESERLDDIAEMGMQQAWDEQDAEAEGVEVDDLYDDEEPLPADIPPDTFGRPPKPPSRKQKDKVKAKKKMAKQSRKRNRK